MFRAVVHGSTRALKPKVEMTQCRKKTKPRQAGRGFWEGLQRSIDEEVDCSPCKNRHESDWEVPISILNRPK